MKITDALKIIHKMGLSWTLFRATYELKKRTGILKRRFQIREFSDEEFFKVISKDDLKDKKRLAEYIKKNRDRFIFDAQDLKVFKLYFDQYLSVDDKAKIIKIADNAIKGKIYCFSRWTADYGDPINWHKNPVTGYEWPKDKHWTNLEELSKDSGDVKYVWEVSRFTQVFYFVRAYTITQNEKYVRAYWDQIEHWLEENPMN